jgi:hypothetical protein
MREAIAVRQSRDWTHCQRKGQGVQTDASNPDTDRTALGQEQWNLGPPNGRQPIDNILAIIYQYFHDCA